MKFYLTLLQMSSQFGQNNISLENFPSLRISVSLLPHLGH